MTDAPPKGDTPAGEAAAPKTFQVWTGKRHVFRVRRPEVYWIAVEVKLIGDTPAVHHEVRILDPDSGEPIGDPVMTDDQGVLRAEVPENKEYKLELVDREPTLFDSMDFALHPEDRGAVLRCQFVHASGEPLVEAEIHAKFEETEDVYTTDEDGRIEGTAQLGLYELTYGDQTFHAHSLPTEHAGRDEAVYHFVVTEDAGDEEQEPAAGEAPESAERLHREHEPEPEGSAEEA